MAKPRHKQPQPQETSSRAPLAFLAIGALLVAGLVAWALTRTVDAPATPPVSTVDTTAAPAPAAGATPNLTPNLTPTPTPIRSTTAGLATSSQAPVIEGDKKEVPRISAEDLREKVKAGNVTVVDVRDALSFEAGHIPGSLNIPLASVEANLDLLPKGKSIVTSCT